MYEHVPPDGTAERERLWPVSMVIEDPESLSDTASGGFTCTKTGLEVTEGEL